MYIAAPNCSAKLPGSNSVSGVDCALKSFPACPCTDALTIATVWAVSGLATRPSEPTNLDLAKDSK